MKAKYEKPIVEILDLVIEENLMDDEDDDAEIGGSSYDTPPF